mgnify:CR=1 FL=1
MLTFHSGEDRRVKKAFAAGLRDGIYAAIAQDVLRPAPEERHANPRSSSAKLRWARRAGNGIEHPCEPFSPLSFWVPQPVAHL